MLRRARDLAAAKIPFVFDPGQGLPMFNGDELAQFVGQATWVAVNDYEGRMLCDRTWQKPGRTLALAPARRDRHARCRRLRCVAARCLRPRARCRGRSCGGPHGLWRCFPGRVASRPGTRLATHALCRTGQPAGRLEDRPTRRAEPPHRSARAGPLSPRPRRSICRPLRQPSRQTGLQPRLNDPRGQVNFQLLLARCHGHAPGVTPRFGKPN